MQSDLFCSSVNQRGGARDAEVETTVVFVCAEHDFELTSWHVTWRKLVAKNARRFSIDSSSNILENH